MSKKYKLTDNSKLYFVSFGVINWIDLLIRNEYRNVSIEKFKALPERKEFRTLWLVFNDELCPFNNRLKAKCIEQYNERFKKTYFRGIA